MNIRIILTTIIAGAACIGLAILRADPSATTGADGAAAYSGDQSENTLIGLSVESLDDARNTKTPDSEGPLPTPPNWEVGAYVTGIDQGSSAAQAGVSKGDIILEWGMHEIASPDDLKSRIHQEAPGNIIEAKCFHYHSDTDRWVPFTALIAIPRPLVIEVTSQSTEPPPNGDSPTFMAIKDFDGAYLRSHQKHANWQYAELTLGETVTWDDGNGADYVQADTLDMAERIMGVRKTEPGKIGILNILGSHGWEYISETTDSNGYTIILFKREQ